MKYIWFVIFTLSALTAFGQKSARVRQLEEQRKKGAGRNRDDKPAIAGNDPDGAELSQPSESSFTADPLPKESDQPAQPGGKRTGQPDHRIPPRNH